jgi:hypothetical protein
MIVWSSSIVLAAVVSFVIGAVWYGFLFADSYTALLAGKGLAASSAPTAKVMAAEFLRCLLIAATMGFLISKTGTVTLQESLLLAVIVWGGLQVTGLVGSVLHEGYAAKLYAIHMGDALAKVVASSLIITGLTSRFS